MLGHGTQLHMVHPTPYPSAGPVYPPALMLRRSVLSINELLLLWVFGYALLKRMIFHTGRMLTAAKQPCSKMMLTIKVCAQKPSHPTQLHGRAVSHGQCRMRACASGWECSAIHSTTSHRSLYRGRVSSGRCPPKSEIWCILPI